MKKEYTVTSSFTFNFIYLIIVKINKFFHFVEVRKCYENQMHEDDRLLEYAKKESEDLDPSKYLDDDEDIKWSDLSYSDRSRCACGTKLDKKKKKKKISSKDCKSLQEQVDRLEFEVQNLLTILHKAQKRTKSRIK